MNILIFGAAGDVGSRTVHEALKRGHNVSAVVRRASQIESLPKNVTPILAEVSADDDLIPQMQDQDLVISTLRPSEGQEERLVALTAQVLLSAQSANVRLIIVGSAARLRILGKVHNSIDRAQFSAPICGEYCKCLLCPVADFQAGRAGRLDTYRTGMDTLIVDKDGLSQISMENFAVALIDEAETAAHRRRIFTVAY